MNYKIFDECKIYKMTFSIDFEAGVCRRFQALLQRYETLQECEHPGVAHGPGDVCDGAAGDVRSCHRRLPVQVSGSAAD